MSPFITSLEEYQQVSEASDGVIFYFSNNVCGACDTLEEKINDLIESRYPKLKMYLISTETNPEIAGQNRVFAAPTVIIYFSGREQERFSRSVGIHQIAQVIDRPYQMIYAS